ncbi:hypothetical protein K469DRAFT_718205 [Zopfia rhizophila CBS 207.26]|uniref:Uncharacterized protein n=1 Tax=Zopfia rhizophila CBS 207.26 TaxID=1314779 RepID=A0A6A6DM28_9PEZI|nr:hypothetical protein K469DRAFT_718205 [Zopfia rhizophila CBS 207.26]
MDKKPENRKPPPVAPTYTAFSPFHEDLLVTLSANSLLGYRVASSTLQEVTGELEDQMHGKCSYYSCKEYMADEVRFYSTTFYKKLPELQCTCDH